jgi:purine-binding chemotaxis protein CheW
VDLRRRFGLDSSETTSGRRILVLAAGGVPTGFVVDSVSEVLKVAVDAIQAAPDLSREQMRLIGRVVNLKAQSRIILLIDPTQLLTEGEASVVAELTETDMAPALQSS